MKPLKLFLTLGLFLGCLLAMGASLEINHQAGTFKVVGDAIPLGSYSNLLIQYATANTVTVTVDTITLADSNNSGKVANAVSVTPDISAAVGANGPDASGLDSVSAWRSIWVISNGTTTAGLLSASQTAPTMPSGYTYKRRVGWVRNDASSNFITSIQRGGWVQKGTSSTNILSAGTATTATNIDVSAYIPPTASLYHAYLQGNAGTCYLTYAGQGPQVAVVKAPESAMGWVPCSTTQNIKYWVESGGNLDLYDQGGYFDNL